MNYAKLIDGKPVFAPNPIRADGFWRGNPPAELYFARGWKPVRRTEPPAAENGCRPVESWTETEEAIVQGWTLEPEGELSEAEVLDILLGGD